MQRFAKAFQQASIKVACAARRTVEDYAGRALPEEPAFTTALVTRIRDALDGFTKSGINWNARILTCHGPGTEEVQYGADILAVLKLLLSGYSVTKGFLAQAKRQEPGSRLRTAEWDRLKQQCKKMLRFTPESYVFVYALNGVFVIPAVSVVACATAVDLHTLYPKNTRQFYKEHFQCFVGDPRLQQIDPSPLQDLRSRSGIEVTGKSEGNSGDELADSSDR